MRRIGGLSFFVCIMLCNGRLFSQDLKLPGMAPSKWIMLKTTQAPGRVYKSLNSQSRTYTHEDFYFRAWVPVVINSRFCLALGPHYRTEQLEVKGPVEGSIKDLSNWQLRSVGVDMKSFVRLDSTSWLVNTANVSKSGNLNRFSSVPLTYTFSAVYLKRKSLNKEIGFGLMVNKSNSLIVLPVFVFNYNYSSRAGLEISLPHRIAWRYNFTPTDILYVKTEAVNRTYFINGLAGADASLFRRIDVDMGVAYNKQINRFLGAEIFAGYRQNLSSKLPGDMIAVKNSGWVGSFEIYIRPPQGLLARRK